MPKKKIALTDEQLFESNIPRRFWTPSRADYFGDPKAIEACEHYITNSKKAYQRGLGLFLRGLPDTGKTWLICYVLRCLMAKKFSVYYTSLEEMTDRLFRPEAESFSAKFIEADFVALDAINTVTGGTEAAFRKFVKLRADNAMPVIAATSMTLEPQLIGDNDPFINSFKEPAQKLVSLSVPIDCSVNQFRIEKHYRKLKDGF